MEEDAASRMEIVLRLAGQIDAEFFEYIGIDI